MKVYGLIADRRIIGYMNKKDFIEKAQELTHYGLNWIKERTCETGNLKEIELAKTQPLVIIELKKVKE